MSGGDTADSATPDELKSVSGSEMETASRIESSEAQEPELRALAGSRLSLPSPAEQISATNFGMIVFGLFSCLSLVVCLAKGIVPIYLYLGESVLWAAAAWYWRKKSLVSPRINLIVLLLGLTVAAGEGYLVGVQSGAYKYTYLKERELQFRISGDSGRTDVLAGTRGWIPVSFDRPPEFIPKETLQQRILLRYSEYSSPGRICFDAQNSSDEFVVQDITIQISPLGNTGGNPIDMFLAGEGPVTLKGDTTLLDRGKEGLLCGRSPEHLKSGWDYSLVSANGWK